MRKTRVAFDSWEWLSFTLNNLCGENMIGGPFDGTADELKDFFKKSKKVKEFTKFLKSKKDEFAKKDYDENFAGKKARKTYSVEEVANVLGTDERTAWLYFRKGYFPIGGKLKGEIKIWLSDFVKL